MNELMNHLEDAQMLARDHMLAARDRAIDDASMSPVEKLKAKQEMRSYRNGFVILSHMVRSFELSYRLDKDNIPLS